MEDTWKTPEHVKNWQEMQSKKNDCHRQLEEILNGAGESPAQSVPPESGRIFLAKEFIKGNCESTISDEIKRMVEDMKLENFEESREKIKRLLYK